PGPASLARGARPAHQLLLPVRGNVMRGWGAPGPGGPSRGIAWRAAPGAAAIAPCTGTVLFAAPFHGYGRLVILACGGGYDAVLAGFGVLAAAPGQGVRAGAALGSLPDAGHAPALYLELRRDGTPIDPAPWLRSG
ncbi:MAG: peptidoglycan DD-metalloendopeptidase family protein, partial [Rhodospirillales bacterium]|nr:peptidoglycan DD-metalloendopeptidase family protein [Rhodospirillales bacterium]